MTPNLSLKEIWTWVSVSQLFSTAITLFIGSYVLYKWQKLHQFRYELVNCIIRDVSSYADDAIEYWLSFVNGASQDRELSSIKLKTSFEYLSQTIEQVKMFKKKANVHAAICELYDVATGNPFESTEESQRNAAPTKIAEICCCAAIAKRVIYLEVLDKFSFWH